MISMAALKIHRKRSARHRDEAFGEDRNCVRTKSELEVQAGTKNVLPRFWNPLWNFKRVQNLFGRVNQDLAVIGVMMRLAVFC